jgi:glycosyltransferase involved in cell wall biosynthesis
MTNNRKDIRITAVIPCFNEEKYIAEVVTKALNSVSDVIVVDDGSSDNTGEVAFKSGARVITHRKGQGAGAATRTGINEAFRSGADIIVTLDGDGQHDATEISILTKPILEGKDDLVIGSRFLRDAKAPIYRKLGINFITWLYNVGHRKKIVDSQCCFRAYSRKALEAINITYPGFGFSIQTLVQVRNSKLQICEVPVSCIYHEDGSTEPPLLHGLNVVMAVIKIRFTEEFFKSGKK